MLDGTKDSSLTPFGLKERIFWRVHYEFVFPLDSLSKVVILDNIFNGCNDGSNGILLFFPIYSTVNEIASTISDER